MYTDLITQLKNGQQARKDAIRIPFSKMDLTISELLSKYGFVGEVSKKGRMPKRYIEIALKYNEDGVGAIRGSRFVSKPSRRLYRGYRDLYPVRQGYGLSVISTSKGIMPSQMARKEKVGGQILFEIW